MSNAHPKASPVDHPAAVELRVLGGFAVVADGQPLPDRAWGRSRKARSLAKVLAFAPRPPGRTKIG
jgi:DNA-binding SARP family transcriptional activator